MNPTRPGEPTPTPRPGTGPQLPIHDDKDERADKDGQHTKSEEDASLHPQEMDREEVESEMPADPDPDDPVSP